MMLHFFSEFEILIFGKAEGSINDFLYFEHKSFLLQL